MKPVDIARVAHEVNRAYGLILGEENHSPWEEASEALQNSAISGVQFRLDNPDAPASAQHDAWMEDKIKDGWVHGEEKDEDAKTHPCLVAYEELPEDQRAKDKLFVAVVNAMKTIEPEKVEVEVPAPTTGKGKAANAAPAVSQVNGMLPIKYIGFREHYTDGTYGTGIQFTKGEVQWVPEDKAKLMLKHPDVYVLGDESNASVPVKQAVSSNAPEKELKKQLTKAQEEQVQDTIMSLNQMGLSAVRTFVKTNFAGRSLPVGINTETARQEAINMIHQLGLPD
jgi:hypothetical protein